MINVTIQPPYVNPLVVRPIHEEVDGDIVASYLAKAKENDFHIHGVRINGYVALIDDHHKSTAMYLLDKPFNLEILQTTHELMQYGKGAARYARTGGMEHLLRIINARFQDLSHPSYNVHHIGDIFVFLRNRDRFERARVLTPETFE